MMQMFQIGRKIVFDLEYWIGEEMMMKEHESVVLGLIIDPSGRHESKCLVAVNFEKFGIPFSRVKSIFPAIGEQLSLF